jgi:hypothetical protein
MNNKRIATENDDRIYKANPRGLGGGWGPCMVCGEGDLNIDCSFFTHSRETGEAIVSMFKKGVYLDYRHFEPNWIQVKIHVCNKHENNLKYLIKLVLKTEDRLDGPGISQEMVDLCLKEDI